MKGIQHEINSAAHFVKSEHDQQMTLFFVRSERSDFMQKAMKTDVSDAHYDDLPNTVVVPVLLPHIQHTVTFLSEPTLTSAV